MFDYHIILIFADHDIFNVKKIKEDKKINMYEYINKHVKSIMDSLILNIRDNDFLLLQMKRCYLKIEKNISMENLIKSKRTDF